MKLTGIAGKLILSIIILLGTSSLKAQVTTDSIRVNGDIDKYYVVSFSDGGWLSNVATDLEIGRSSTHRGGSNNGSMIAKFRFHVGNWGHGSSFIDADLRESNVADPSKRLFIAGWQDATADNSSYTMVVWLRGNTTYFYRSSFPVTPKVYDGTAFPISYKPGNTTYTVKTTIDANVNTYGYTSWNTAYYVGAGTNYFNGNLGIGTLNTGTSKLAVEGIITARRVRVTQSTAWPDIVFAPEYKLPSLSEVETYIKANKHLPDVPSAAEVVKDGVDLGEMNKILLQKIEELTLHLIEQEKRIKILEKKNAN